MSWSVQAAPAAPVRIKALLDVDPPRLKRLVLGSCYYQDREWVSGVVVLDRPGTLSRLEELTVIRKLGTIRTQTHLLLAQPLPALKCINAQALELIKLRSDLGAAPMLCTTTPLDLEVYGASATVESMFERDHLASRLTLPHGMHPRVVCM